MHQLMSLFNRISNAPDAIPRLRRFILNLAMRGKLVEQDPKDEPASELRNRIQAGRARLVKVSIKKEPLLDIRDESWPFELPRGWCWVRFGEIFLLEYGDNLPAEKRSNTEEYPVYGSNGIVGSHSVRFVREPCIVVGRKGSAGALNLSMTEGCCVTDVAYYCIPPRELDLMFSFKLFHTLGLDTLGKGIKPGLNRNEAYELPLALPPLAEQQRIVAKVDELMALCDRLEAARVERESRRDSLATVSLQRLNKPADEPSTFQEHARFCFNHLPRLTTRLEHMHQLRQTILNLAARGKLVRQSSKDDSPESLLSEIRKTRARTPNRSKNSEVDDSDPKFIQHLPKPLPYNWVACSLEDLFRFIDYRGRTPMRTTRGVRLITAKNVRMGYIAEEPIEFIDEQVYSKWMTRGLPRSGDLLFVTEGATMGYVGTIDLRFEFALAQRTIDLQPHLSYYSKFFLFTLMSPLFQEAVLTNSTGTAVKGIKAAKLKRIRVPVPPLTEQHRIVAKVEELMALCDRLEAQLTTTQTESHRLLEAVLHDALAQTA